MPARIFCPKCGAEGTDYANQVIEQTLFGEGAVGASSTIQRPRIRLQVANPPAASNDENLSADGMDAGEKCHRHPRNLAIEHCVVCKKPICPECMEIFGYLCSIGCRYRAEQEKIPVPVYQFQKNLVERGALRKSIGITVGVLCLLIALIGAWVWYIMVGDKPRPYYSLKVSADESGTYAQFFGPGQILLLNKKQISLHDIKSKKNLWSTALEDPKPTPEPDAVAAKATKTPFGSDEAEEFFTDASSARAEPFFHGEDLWLCLSHNVVGINLKTGSVKQTVPFQGRLAAFTPGESTLLVVSEKSPAKKIVTQITLASGEIKTSEVASSLREKVSTSKDLPSNVLPTAALLLKRELDAQEKHQTSVYKFSSEFFPAGQNLVEMQVKLVEAKMVSVQTMKAPGPSNLGQDTRASTSARAVAEEIFNELKRSNTGGHKMVDDSRYAVMLRRTMENNAVDWTGDVTGLPIFFPQKTVDVLVGGTNLFLFDKQNKKIAESQLAFPLADSFTSDYGRTGRAPCVEADNILFLFDKGFLTAFNLPAGTVRWRLTSVGISGIQFDNKGMLYVSTTTGAPEDIQYSEQIKMNDAAAPIILKVDPKSGKTLWKCEKSGGGCFLTGKYLYITDAARGGLSMINAVEDAFGTASSAPGNFKIVRIDPSNGKKLWSFNKKGVPENIDFSENRILLHYGKEIQVMKFLSF
ncbi:MAG: hypothetical protein ABIW93_05685 [Verrucomicrobiota bacterium]